MHTQILPPRHLPHFLVRKRDGEIPDVVAHIQGVTADDLVANAEQLCRQGDMDAELCDGDEENDEEKVDLYSELGTGVSNRGPVTRRLKGGGVAYSEATRSGPSCRLCVCEERQARA